jgi:hypothetical protein
MPTCCALRCCLVTATRLTKLTPNSPHSYWKIMLKPILDAANELPAGKTFWFGVEGEFQLLSSCMWHGPEQRGS